VNSQLKKSKPTNRGRVLASAALFRFRNYFSAYYRFIKLDNNTQDMKNHSSLNRSKPGDAIARCAMASAFAVLLLSALPNSSAMSCGRNHACFIKTTGQMLCRYVSLPLLALAFIVSGKVVGRCRSDSTLVVAYPACPSYSSNHRPEFMNYVRYLVCVIANVLVASKGLVLFLRCRGWNVSGQIAVPKNLSWKKVAAGAAFTCGITNRSALRCWGYDAYKQASPPKGLQWKFIAAGENHAMGITRQGMLQLWGNNDRGQLNLPMRPPQYGDSWHSACGGASHSCALTKKGGLYCSGSNLFGQATVPQLGVGWTWKSITCGNYFSCGLVYIADQNKTVIRCFGSDSRGQTIVPPIDSGSASWYQVDAGDDFTCAIGDGIYRRMQVQCWGDNQVGFCDYFGRIHVFREFFPTSLKHLTVLCHFISIQTGELTYPRGVTLVGHHTYVSSGGGFACMYSNINKNKPVPGKPIPVTGVQCWGDNRYRQHLNNGGKFYATLP
jgi:hypothetical protein